MFSLPFHRFVRPEFVFRPHIKDFVHLCNVAKIKRAVFQFRVAAQSGLDRPIEPILLVGQPDGLVIQVSRAPPL